MKGTGIKRLKYSNTSLKKKVSRLKNDKIFNYCTREPVIVEMLLTVHP